MKKIIISFVATAVIVLGAASGAQAGELLFSITGVDTASFTLDSAPTPDGFFAPTAPYFDNVPGALDGSLFVFPVVTFYGPANDGGVTGATQPGADGTVYFDTFGPTIFSGSATAPNFAPGVFGLDNIAGVPTDALTISAVPEPATWAMMLAGFGALVFMMRMRRKSFCAEATA